MRNSANYLDYTFEQLAAEATTTENCLETPGFSKVILMESCT